MHVIHTSLYVRCAFLKWYVSGPGGVPTQSFHRRGWCCGGALCALAGWERRYRRRTCCGPTPARCSVQPPRNWLLRWSLRHRRAQLGCMCAAEPGRIHTTTASDQTHTALSHPCFASETFGNEYVGMPPIDLHLSPQRLYRSTWAAVDAYLWQRCIVTGLPARPRSARHCDRSKAETVKALCMRYLFCKPSAPMPCKAIEGSAASPRVSLRRAPVFRTAGHSGAGAGCGGEGRRGRRCHGRGAASNAAGAGPCQQCQPPPAGAEKKNNCMRRGIAANIVCCCRSRACFSPSYTRLTQPTLTKMMKLNVMALLFAFSCSIVSWQV